MRNLVIGLVLVALLAAGGTAFFVKRFLDRQAQVQTDAAQQQASVTKSVVLVAGRDLPAGTTITASMVRWQPWPDDGVSKDFVVATSKDKKLEDQFVGTVVRRGLSEGTPFTKSSVFRKGETKGYLAGALDPGMRAVAVAVSDKTGAAGFILPGDHVDVVLTHDVRKDAPRGPGAGDALLQSSQAIRHTAETILRGIRVLAVDQKVDDFKEDAAIGKTVTLEVSAKQVEIMALAVTMGSISLALRSLATGETEDDERSFTTDLQVSPTLLRSYGRLAQEQKGAVQPRPAVQQPARVKVYRGGQMTSQEGAGR